MACGCTTTSTKISRKIYNDNKFVDDRRKEFNMTLSMNETRWGKWAKHLERQRVFFIQSLNKQPINKIKVKELIRVIVGGADQFADTMKRSLCYRMNNNDHVLLDISRIPTSEHFERGKIVQALVVAQSISCETRLTGIMLELVPTARTTVREIIREFRNELNTFPRSPSQRPVPRILEINTIMLIANTVARMGMVRIGMRFFRACLAACRLRIRHGGLNCEEAFTLGKKSQKAICELICVNKINSKAKRPFYSKKRLEFIEQDLNIGHHLTPYRICSQCQRSDYEIVLYKCSEGRRVWYCGKECQQSIGKSTRNIAAQSGERKTFG
jgi:hypothetical protein